MISSKHFSLTMTSFVVQLVALSLQVATMWGMCDAMRSCRDCVRGLVSKTLRRVHYLRQSNEPLFLIHVQCRFSGQDYCSAREPLSAAVTWNSSHTALESPNHGNGGLVLKCILNIRRIHSHRGATTCICIYFNLEFIANHAAVVHQSVTIATREWNDDKQFGMYVEPWVLYTCCVPHGHHRSLSLLFRVWNVNILDYYDIVWFAVATNGVFSGEIAELSTIVEHISDASLLRCSLLFSRKCGHVTISIIFQFNVMPISIQWGCSALATINESNLISHADQSTINEPEWQREGQVEALNRPHIYFKLISSIRFFGDLSQQRNSQPNGAVVVRSERRRFKERRIVGLECRARDTRKLF